MCYFIIKPLLHPQNPTQKNMKTASFIPFASRCEAGRSLAKILARYTGDPETVVLALPKGGVSVGVEIAHCLGLPFSPLLLERITAPGCGNTRIGAITSGGVRVLDSALIDRLRISDEDIHLAVLKKAVRLARREHYYRSQRPSIRVADRTVILADDGSSSCVTLRDAIHLLRRQHVDHVIVALPVACNHAACDLRMEADEVLSLLETTTQVPATACFESPAPIRSADVCELLNREFETATGNS